MLSHNELKKGTKFILDGQPCEVLDSSFVFKGRGSSVSKTKIRNLITGNVIAKTFHAGEEFKEAEVKKIEVRFLYSHRDNYFFCPPDNPADRFSLEKDIIGSSVVFLKENEVVEAMEFQGKIINISLPVKVNLKVTEAPPGVKGDRAQGGTKIVVLETGAKINVPLFVETGDIIEVNTEKEEYVKRAGEN